MARNQDSSRRTVNVEDISSKAMVAIDGASFNWSYMADEEVPTNLALMAFSDSEPEFEGHGFKTNKCVCENSSNEIKKTTDAPIIEDWVSNCDEDDSEVMVLKSDNVQHKPEQANQPKKVSQNIRKNRTNWNEIKTQKLGVRFQFTKKACFVCVEFLTINFKDYEFCLQQQFLQSGHSRVSAARPINIAALKSFVNATKSRPNAFQKSHSPSRRPFYQQTALKNKNLNDKVNIAKVNSINTAKGNRVTSAVREQRINAVKSSACWSPQSVMTWIYNEKLILSMSMYANVLDCVSLLV
ncbi:hypothetical protein Tco_1203221 [Tanacetum coccineum]